MKINITMEKSKKTLTKKSKSPMINRDGLPNSDHWATPDWLYEELNKEFHFDFDPCPLNSEFDGLKVEWGKSNFVNPPYNKIDKPKFIKKAFDEWMKGKTCVLLIPSATGTKQFHELIFPNAEVRFLKGRVAFKGYNTKGVYSTKNKGKHDSMIVIFRAGQSYNNKLPKNSIVISPACDCGEKLVSNGKYYFCPLCDMSANVKC